MYPTRFSLLLLSLLFLLSSVASAELPEESTGEKADGVISVERLDKLIEQFHQVPLEVTYTLEQRTYHPPSSVLGEKGEHIVIRNERVFSNGKAREEIGYWDEQKEAPFTSMKWDVSVRSYQNLLLAENVIEFPGSSIHIDTVFHDGMQTTYLKRNSTAAGLVWSDVAHFDGAPNKDRYRHSIPGYLEKTKELLMDSAFSKETSESGNELILRRDSEGIVSPAEAVISMTGSFPLLRISARTEQEIYGDFIEFEGISLPTSVLFGQDPNGGFEVQYRITDVSYHKLSPDELPSAFELEIPDDAVAGQPPWDLPGILDEPIISRDGYYARPVSALR